MPGISSNPHALKIRRMGIDTHQEPVIYMRADCHICRSEGSHTCAPPRPPSRVAIKIDPDLGGHFQRRYVMFAVGRARCHRRLCLKHPAVAGTRHSVTATANGRVSRRYLSLRQHSVNGVWEGAMATSLSANPVSRLKAAGRRGNGVCPARSSVVAREVFLNDGGDESCYGS